MSILTEWAEYMAATGAAEATVKIRTQTIQTLMNHQGVSDPLLITRRHVVAFLARPTAQWTKVTYWRSIKAFSIWLREFDYDPASDLLKGFPKPRIPEPAARPIDDATVNTLLKATFSHRTRAYILLALYGGLRVHEIAKLRGEDLDLAAGWLMICGKGGITKPIPIHGEIMKLAEVMPEEGFWFPSAKDPRTHVQAESVSNTISAALRSVGCRATAHQLRDTAATRFQRQVKDIRLTQSLLRHRSIASTMKYTAVSDTELQNAVALLSWDKAA
jgi:integrase/recombinase XerD